MTPARERALSLGLLVVGAALMLLAGGQVWFRGRAIEPGLPAVPLRLTGRDVAALVSAVGLLALAAAAVALLTGRTARRLIGAVVLVGGIAAAWRCAYVLTHQSAAALDSARRALESSTLGPSATTRVDLSAWPWVALVGSLLVVAGAAMLALRAGRWPGRSSRYDAATLQSGKASAAPVDPADEMWKALDRGEDPTDSPGEPSRS